MLKVSETTFKLVPFAIASYTSAELTVVETNARAC